MTDSQIESLVSRRIDLLDRQYMNSGMTRAEYDAAIAAVDNWATRQYAARKLAAVPFVDVSTVTEYGLTQKLTNAIRVF